MAMPSPDVRVAHPQRSGADPNRCAERRDEITRGYGALVVQPPLIVPPACALKKVCRGRVASQGDTPRLVYGRATNV